MATELFDIVYADPPWPYYGSPDKMAAAGKHYSLLTLTEIARMEKPLARITSPSAALFLWSTSSRLPDAVSTLKTWGFHFRGVAFVWVKIAKVGGHIISGQGVPPTAVKPNAEFVLFGTRQETGRPFPLLDASIGQVVLATRGKHSKKPDEIRTRIERIYGDRPRLELFARDSYPGWTSSGLESDGADYRSGCLVKNGD